MQNYVALIVKNEKVFLLLTCCLTLLFLFAHMRFWNYHYLITPSYFQRSCVIHDTRTSEPKSELRSGPSNIPFLIDELLRINHSVRNELIVLDRRRIELLDNAAILQSHVEHLRSVLMEQSRQFMRSKTTLDSYERKIKELKQLSITSTSHIPDFDFKTDWISGSDSILPSPSSISPCTLESCINWNRCNFTNYLKICSDSTNHDEFSYITQYPHFTYSCKSEENACLRFVFNPIEAPHCFTSNPQHDLTCVALFTNLTIFSKFHEKYSGDQPKLILASYTFLPRLFRLGFDFLLPINLEYLYPNMNSIKTGSTHPSFSLLPGRRSIRIGSSFGFYWRQNKPIIPTYDRMIIRYFHLLSTQSLSYPTQDYSIHFWQDDSELSGCWSDSYRQFLAENVPANYDWIPCENSLSILYNSTFCLILDHSLDMTPDFGVRAQLVNCLATGAVPVVLSNNPLIYTDEAISSALLSRSMVRIPKPRFRELPSIVQSIPESHIVEMRRQGQILFERHLKNKQTAFNTFLLALSRRLGFPQPPAPLWTAISAFGVGSPYEPINIYSVNKEALLQTDLEEFLGPTGPQQSSERFQTNYTGIGGSALMGTISQPGGDLIANPFWLHEFTPWNPALPSDAAFTNHIHTSQGLRPINHSLNLAGFEFNMHLGGMYPYEQFTIIMLTYNRHQLACQTLERFYNLPYLHSIIVVWNHPIKPTTELTWPKLHVPLKVIQGRNNSLNNRFLPYDLIETEAILSIDDDIQLRHDEIIFGFRVWREHRDQLVGFPARAHFWNSTERNWYYNSDYTCEFSMILTGASFFHKYYTFAYTIEMPLAIRQMVDELMNCEDLAMNFLVSHMTRKPPLKVTLHWSFDCPYCGPALHDRSNHYKARSDCINRLTQMYGYNPLVYSQYRVDSMLFKTRIPSTKQKCYKFI